LLADLKSLIEPSREHYHRGSMFQQLFDVSGLYTDHVVSASLVPIPLSRASWEKLGIFEGTIFDL